MASKAKSKKGSRKATAARKKKSAGRGASRPVRIGFVGVGSQGSFHLDCALGMEGVEVPAVCDTNNANLYRVKRWIEEGGKPEPHLYEDGNFQALCEEEDLDLVVCATSWKWHTPVLLAAMRNGKHAVSEVPIVLNVDEAWELVETYEKTGKWGTMGLKGVHSCLSNMIRLGMFGRIVHCEDGYVHDLRRVKFDPHGEPWRLQHSIDRNGCLYPDHPTCRVIPLLNVNHGDRFEYLVSMSSNAVMLNEYAASLYGGDHPYATMKMKQGDYNCTLIRTANGSMYTLNFDTNTPHPRGFFRMQGTKGVFFHPKGMEPQIYLDGVSPNPHQWEPAAPYLKKYEHPVINGYKPRPRKALRGHAGGGRITPIYWHRLVEAVRGNRVSDFDVYDSVTSSVISPLTEMSVAKGSKPVEFPDFTRGKWKTRPSLESDA